MAHNQPELLVADSFRVRAHPVTGEPEVRNLHAHFARFKASTLEAFTGTGDHGALKLQEFLTDARGRIAEYGAGWPRLELWGVPSESRSTVSDQGLRLSLRPLPVLGETLEVRTKGHVPVTHPERKGPNIARYAELNRELAAEALLTDEHGKVREGATTSLVWWRDDTLCVSPDRFRVASVTEYIVRDFAAAHQIGTLTSSAHPAELASCEVWALNALHGIRRVTSIDGVGFPSFHEDRLRKFQAALDTTWQPLRG